MVGQGLADRLTQIIMQKASWSEQKEQKRKRRRRTVVSFVGLTVLVLLFAYMFVWQRVYTLQLAEEYSHRKQNVRLLKEKCQALQYEVEYLASLENIEVIARGQLAMMPVREAQFAKAVQLPVEKKPTLEVEVPAVAKTDTVSKAPGKKSATPQRHESSPKLAMLTDPSSTARSDAGPKPAVLKNSSTATKSVSNSKATVAKKSASTSKKRTVNKSTKPAAKKTGAKGKGAGKTGK